MRRPLSQGEAPRNRDGDPAATELSSQGCFGRGSSCGDGTGGAGGGRAAADARAGLRRRRRGPTSTRPRRPCRPRSRCRSRRSCCSTSQDHLSRLDRASWRRRWRRRHREEERRDAARLGCRSSRAPRARSLRPPTTAASLPAAPAVPPAPFPLAAGGRGRGRSPHRARAGRGARCRPDRR